MLTVVWTQIRETHNTVFSGKIHFGKKPNVAWITFLAMLVCQLADAWLWASSTTIAKTAVKFWTFIFSRGWIIPCPCSYPCPSFSSSCSSVQLANAGMLTGQTEMVNVVTIIPAKNHNVSIVTMMMNSMFFNIWGKNSLWSKIILIKAWLWNNFSFGS